MFGVCEKGVLGGRSGGSVRDESAWSVGHGRDRGLCEGCLGSVRMRSAWDRKRSSVVGIWDVGSVWGAQGKGV